MSDLLSFSARICPTAGGFLIHQHQILLVKHKKLGIWLAPGGHIEEGEQPHQAAEREVFEETGIKVETLSAITSINSTQSQYLPIPLYATLHWISKDNYQARINSPHPNEPHQTPLWPRGCEQHLGYFYLVKALGSIIPTIDPTESDDLGWFGSDQIEKLETTADIKSEIQLAFTVSQQIFK